MITLTCNTDSFIVNRLLTLQLVNEHLFDDSLHDWFERDPYTALFEVRLASSRTFYHIYCLFKLINSQNIKIYKIQNILIWINITLLCKTSF